MTFEGGFQDDLLHIDTIRDGDEVEVAFKGKCMYAGPPDHVAKLMKQLHQEVLDAGIKTLIFDVMDLSYANSSGLKIFLTVLMALNETPQDKRYQLHFRLNKSIGWQQQSFSNFSLVLPKNLTLSSELP